MYAMITYPVGQLEILFHTIKNFKTYKMELKNRFDGMNDGTAAKLMMKNCVDMHLLIIKWVYNLIFYDKRVKSIAYVK